MGIYCYVVTPDGEPKNDLKFIFRMVFKMHLLCSPYLAECFVIYFISYLSPF